MSFDLIIRIAGREGELVDIAVAGGRIAALETGAGREEPVGGRLVVPGP